MMMMMIKLVVILNSGKTPFLGDGERELNTNPLQQIEEAELHIETQIRRKFILLIASTASTQKWEKIHIYDT